MSGLGFIGELQVMEHLEKKLGCEIYIPLKDKGIDLVAKKGQNFYSIQVKTSKFQKNSYFWFDLHKSKMVYSSNTFYVFVLYITPKGIMMGKKKNYLVIPSLDLQKFIKRGQMPIKKNSDDVINMYVYLDENLKTWTYKNINKSFDLTKYWNNFTGIK